VVVFVGGVALGQPATSIPIAAIVGLVAGLLAGIIMYQIASRISEYSSDILKQDLTTHTP
jgi:high-affinity Fe2+/Pb2+ permease